MQRRYRRSARLCNARAGPCQVSNRPGREPRGSTPGAQASARRAAGTRSRRAGEATGAKGCGVPQLRAGRAERQRKTVKAAAPIGGGIIGSVDDTHAPLVPTTPTRDTRTARVPATARAPSRASCRLPSCTARSAHCPRLRRFTPFGFTSIDTDLALFLIRLPPPRLTPLLCAWAALHRFTWQVEEGSPRRKARTPFLESPCAEPKAGVRRGGGVLVR